MVYCFATSSLASLLFCLLASFCVQWWYIVSVMIPVQTLYVVGFSGYWPVFVRNEEFWDEEGVTFGEPFIHFLIPLDKLIE